MKIKQRERSLLYTCKKLLSIWSEVFGVIPITYQLIGILYTILGLREKVVLSVRMIRI